MTKNQSAELNDSSTEQDNVVTDSDFQINASRSMKLFQEDTDHPLTFSEELSQSTKQNNFFSNSNLATIKEVSLDSEDVLNHERAATCS